MVNHFPWWKNVLIIVIIILGTFYALPNIFGKTPAVQITGANGNQANVATLTKVEDALSAAKISANSVTLANGTILAKFKNAVQQLSASDAISEALGNRYTVALNLASNTPKFLADLGGSPMKLGLDLRGGVRFMMQVDFNAALKNFQADRAYTLAQFLNKNNVHYTNIAPGADFSNVISFPLNVNVSNIRVLIAKSDANYLVKILPGNKLSVNLTYLQQQRLQENAIKQNIVILRKRIAELNVSGATVQQQGLNDVIIELPGIQNTARARQILGATATLAFKLVNTNVSLSSALRGYLPSDSELRYTSNGTPVILYRHTIVGGEHIINAEVARTQTGAPQVNITLDTQGGKLMSAATANAVGRPMATLYIQYEETDKDGKDGKPILKKIEKVINVATINSRLGTNFEITGIGTIQQAQTLVTLLKSGSLLAPVEIVQQNTVGPTLGESNIQMGYKASVVGMLVVILFMLIVYKKFGIFADLALILNIILLVAAMSILPGTTLSMPGIAGIVLSVGMSVDANVLIFERIKEELRNGRTVQQAIHEGYAGAFSSIFDANLTTILTAGILYAIGAGPVRGFATTLALGVAISMFTAITGTRAIVNILYGNNKNIKKISI